MAWQTKKKEKHELYRHKDATVDGLDGGSSHHNDCCTGHHIYQCMAGREKGCEMEDGKKQSTEAGTDSAETGSGQHMKKLALHKARYKYLCAICLGTIKKGERYVRDSRKGPCKARPYTIHITCAKEIYGEEVEG